MYRLVFTGRFAERPAWEARKPLVFLGRGTKCDVRLAEDGVSECHAAIEQQEDGYHIRDLGSANGVRVNDKPVTVARLATGDEVEMGVVQFRFEVLHLPLPQGRSLDLMQVTVGVIIVGLLVGQALLLGSVFSSPRSGKMRIDSGSQPRTAAIVPSSGKTDGAGTASEEDILIPQPSAGSASVPVVLNRQLCIMRVDRVDGTNNVALRIQVHGGVGERDLNSRVAAVSVQFFRVSSMNSAVALEVLWLPMPARWDNYATQKFAAQFNGLPSQYAGYVVKTYYRNQLQDMKAEPPSLAGNMGGAR